MKDKSYISFCILVVSMVLFSCDDFLSENPKSQLPEDEAYGSLSALYANGVASLYNNIGGYEDSQGLQGTGRGVYDLNTFTTDEAIMPTRGGDWYDGGFWQGLFLHEWGINNSAIRATWEYLYRVVILCNESLDKIENFGSPEDYPELISYQAEVRAMRALFYYQLLDLFGNVPLVISVSPSAEEMKQAKRGSVYRFVIDELQEVAPVLKDVCSNASGTYYGRITRPVAHFLLAKLALNAEVYADDDWTDGVRPDGKNIFFDVDGKQLNAWETTEHYCDLITEMGYRLADNFQDNFAVFNESSVENIFTVSMNKNLYTNQMIYLFRSRHYNHAKAYGMAGENGSSATVEALQTFGYGTVEEDPRFGISYYADTVYDLDGDVVKLDNGKVLAYYPWEVRLDLSHSVYEKTAGARMKKYEIDRTAIKDGKLMENDIVLYRYADVLLMACEAKVRNGKSGDNELNLVRGRVGASSRAATLENILAERMLEFAWEGWRRQDLIRFGAFTRSYTERPQLSGEENGYTTVFPIPEQIRLMNPGWEQNPGY